GWPCPDITQCSKPECNQWFFFTNYGQAYVTRRGDYRLFSVFSGIYGHDIQYKWDSHFTVNDLHRRDEAEQECADVGHEWGYWLPSYCSDEEDRACRRCQVEQRRLSGRPRGLNNGQCAQARQNERFLPKYWGTHTFDVIEHEGWRPT